MYGDIGKKGEAYSNIETVSLPFFIVDFLIEKVFLVAFFIDYIAAVVHLGSCAACCVYCPQFFSFSTVKELGGVAVAKGHLLWQI